MHNYFLYLFVFIAFSSCDNTKTPSLKDYYFPIQSLDKKAKVYEYQNFRNEEGFTSHYWQLKSNISESKTFLFIEEFNPLFQKDMAIKEWIVDNGVITKSYDLFTIDSMGKTQTHPNQIKQSVVFPFLIPTDSAMVYKYECQFKLPPDFLIVKLKRERKFKKFSTAIFQGKEINTAVFSREDWYDIEDKVNGGFWLQKKYASEIYGEGIGLIEEEVQTEGETETQITKLTSIYSEEEFKKKKKQ